MTRCAAVCGRLRCANRPYVVWALPSISRLAALVMTTSPYFPPDFTLASHSLIFPSQIPSIFCPLINGPACHRGGEGPVRGEQDDEIVDQIRVGRGLDTGGELLGRQCAGGGDAPWPGWRLTGADSRLGCGSPDGRPFLVSGEFAVDCCREWYLRALIPPS